MIVVSAWLFRQLFVLAGTSKFELDFLLYTQRNVQYTRNVAGGIGGYEQKQY